MVAVGGLMNTPSANAEIVTEFSGGALNRTDTSVAVPIFRTTGPGTVTEPSQRVHKRVCHPQHTIQIDLNGVSSLILLFCSNRKRHTKYYRVCYRSGRESVKSHIRS
jgi:hypothetical protein